MPYKDPEVRRAKQDEYTRRWREKNREKYLEQSRARYRANPEKRIKGVLESRNRHRDRFDEYMAKYRIQHKAEISARTKEYRKEHPENSRRHEATRRAERLANPELLAKRREGYKAYYEKNREKAIANVTAYRKKYPEKTRVWSVLWTARRRKARDGYCNPEQWLARISYYGWSCGYCGISVTLDTMHRDHVKPISAGGSEWPSNMVPACKACNLKKHTKRWMPHAIWAMTTS